MLTELSESSSSSSARLALLERARLLAYELGEVAEAQRLLSRFVDQGRTDALTQEAWLERCVLLLETRAREETLACIDGLASRFPASRRNPKVKELRSRLEAMRSGH